MQRRFGLFFFFIFSGALFGNDIQNSFPRTKIVEGLPASIVEDLERIITYRDGDLDNSSMVTSAVVGHIQNRVSYSANQKGLVEANECAAGETAAVSVPPNVHFSGRWTQMITSGASEANVLGKSGTLLLEQGKLQIPVAKPTSDNLAFYGAKLIKWGEILRFDVPYQMPVSIMNVGSNYVEGYLMRESLGGGAYLERHDLPHFHMPIDPQAHGYLLIGKEDRNGSYRVSAFPIPYGYAIYTPGWALHCDAFLVGDFIVVYSITENYETANLKSNAGNLVEVTFAENDS